MTTINNLTEKFRTMEIDHDPDGWPAVQMKEVTALCDTIESTDLSLNKLNSYLMDGHKIVTRNDMITLVDKYGCRTHSAATLQELLIRII